MTSRDGKELYYEDEKLLMEFFVEESFAQVDDSPFLKSPQYSQLELIITPECNQKCDYCYITRFGNKLYPKEIRADHDTTLANIKKIMDYLVYEKHFIFNQYELFAGDLFGTNLFFDTLDVLYPYFEYISRKAPEIFFDGPGKHAIIVPCNMRFVNNDEIVARYFEYQEKFDKIHFELALSWSHDGKYAQDVREKVEFTDEYYDKAFKFIKKAGAGIHPMISTQAIDHAIENFDWWVEMYEKYLPERMINGEYMPIHLEVRNDGWTDEKIEKYLELLRHRLNWIVERYNGDIDEVARYLFRVGDTPLPHDCDQFDFVTNKPNTETSTSCALQNSLMIRVSDMAIVPCHRTCYTHLIGGWFETNEDGKICGIKPGNVGQYIDTKSHNVLMAPECCICWNNYNCLHGCIGSQFEYSGELYLPIPSVCKMMKAKTSFILKMFVETGILRSAHNQGILSESHIKHYKELCARLGYQYE